MRLFSLEKKPFKTKKDRFSPAFLILIINLYFMDFESA